MLPSGILIHCTGPFWSDSLCLFGFCLPSLLCLISTLTQAGGGGLLFRFAGSGQSRYGEGGELQTDIAVCGEHSPCSSHTGFALHRGICAFPVYTAQAPGCSIWSGPCVECGSSFQVLYKSADLVAPVCCVFPGLSSSGSQRLVRILPGAVHLFPPWLAAQAARGLGSLSPGAVRLFPLRRVARAARSLCVLSPGVVRLFPQWWVARVARGLVHSPAITVLFLFNHSVVSNSLPPHSLQHAMFSCPSLSSRVCSNLCLLNRWCHLIISSSVPFLPLLSFNIFQQGILKWVSSLHQVA